MHKSMFKIQINIYKKIHKFIIKAKTEKIKQNQPAQEPQPAAERQKQINGPSRQISRDDASPLLDSEIDLHRSSYP